MLIKVSQIVKEKIKDIPKITPETYNTIFLEEALKLGMDITDISGICSIADTFQEHCDRLELNTTSAITAITNNDTNALQDIKNNVLTLKNEIALLKHLVYEDGLTKVYNRKYLIDKVLDEAENFKTDGVIAIIDLNDLKYINDNIGHNAGDKVISLLATKLKELTDETIRYGGDEFILLFKNETDIASTYKRFHILRELLLKQNYKFNKHAFQISFSFATLRYDSGSKFEEILDIVDAQMYIDKKKNKKPMVHITP